MRAMRVWAYGTALALTMCAGCATTVRPVRGGDRLSAAGGSGVPSIVMPQDYEAARASSHDPTGGNQDNRPIPAGGTLQVADLQGPGMITHCWFTMASDDPAYLSNVILQIRWDGATEPAVDSPIGPFFALGHNEVADVNSLPITVMAGRANYIKYPPGLGAFNCYFCMPFHRRAEISVVNRGTQDLGNFFYHIDWRRYETLPADARYFHAHYRSERTQVATQPADRNVTGESDYVILDAKGPGHYVGCTLHVEAHRSEAGKWYEGDEAIVADGRPYQSGLMGTGTEDYFGLAWGVRRIFQGLYAGSSYVAWNEDEPKMFCYGRFSVYRWHLPDPVPFRESIRVSIEHGHNNDAANRYASVAYWYAARP